MDLYTSKKRTMIPPIAPMSECNVCVNQTFLYNLECGHKYCMSCIKRIYNDELLKKCPACTASINSKYYHKITETPDQILKIGDLQEILKDYQYVWLYKGRNVGWWVFDIEYQNIIEESFSKGSNINITICGYDILLDFVKMEQTSINGAVREIARVLLLYLPNILVKGIAGMK